MNPGLLVDGNTRSLHSSSVTASNRSWSIPNDPFSSAPKTSTPVIASSFLRHAAADALWLSCPRRRWRRPEDLVGGIVIGPVRLSADGIGCRDLALPREVDGRRAAGILPGHGAR